MTPGRSNPREGGDERSEQKLSLRMDGPKDLVSMFRYGSSGRRSLMTGICWGWRAPTAEGS